MNEIDPFAAEAAWLLALSPLDRARFFACLGHNLTIAIRGLCHGSDGTAEAVEPVRQLNEAHHRVASYLSHYLWGDDEYPGWSAVVVDYVLNHKNQVAHAHARHAWESSTRTMEARRKA